MDIYNEIQQKNEELRNAVASLSQTGRNYAEAYKKYGIVGKVYDITNEPSVDIGIGIMPEVNAVWIDKDKINYLNKEDITKHSKDIIDLIEEKDTLLIYDKEYDEIYKSDVIEDNDKNLCVIDYEYNKIIDLKLELYLGNIEIRSILTHEQFEANAYKIEKER